MQDLYFGTIDAIASQDKSLPVVVLDNPKYSEALSHVPDWLEGRIQLVLVNGFDIPNIDGVYLCTDANANVRYGIVRATAANCFVFQERYANCGSTSWYDVDSADKGTMSGQELDIKSLSNWVLLLPLASGNKSDISNLDLPTQSAVSKFFNPNTKATPYSGRPCPRDHRTTSDKDRDTFIHPRELGEHFSRVTYSKWLSQLRGDNFQTFYDFLAGTSGDDLNGRLVDHKQMRDWMNNIDLTTLSAISMLTFSREMVRYVEQGDLFVIARRLYSLVTGAKLGRNVYYDRRVKNLPEINLGEFETLGMTSAARQLVLYESDFMVRDSDAKLLKDFVSVLDEYPQQVAAVVLARLHSGKATCDTNIVVPLEDVESTIMNIKNHISGDIKRGHIETYVKSVIADVFGDEACGKFDRDLASGYFRTHRLVDVTDTYANMMVHSASVLRKGFRRLFPENKNYLFDVDSNKGNYSSQYLIERVVLAMRDIEPKYIQSDRACAIIKRAPFQSVMDMFLTSASIQR